jgi:hypothetical protein
MLSRPGCQVIGRGCTICRTTEQGDEMSEGAGEAAQPGSTPEVDPNWFKQIKFDPRLGLDSVLPMQIPVLPDDFQQPHG